MRTSFLTASTIVFVACLLTACAPGSAHSNNETRPAGKTMRPFSSERELRSYLREIAERRKRETRGTGGNFGGGGGSGPGTGFSSPTDARSIVDNDESVTNTQHSGVDEGGIVKLHGDHLVILRRGRLFTVAVGDETLKPVSAIDAFGPDIDPRHAWYDEMLVSGDTIAVIGYSYERGGTEVGLFGIDREGKLSYRSTYHLRSDDYYSSRNYASRLIGDKLIFYAPLYLDQGAEDPLQSLPAVRKWRKGAAKSEFRRTVTARRVYRPAITFYSTDSLALHTVTVCDLSNGGFSCEATSVVGPVGRVFYVSPQAVYVWVTDWRWRKQRDRSRSMLYRMPLDGSAPSAVTVSGSPIDQFSFLESEDGNVNVVVRSDGNGDAMWNAENSSGAVALMRVPLAKFSDGSEAVPASNYFRLSKPEGYTFHNRFIGEYLLYGSGSGWGPPEKRGVPTLYVVRWAGSEDRANSAAPLSPNQAGAGQVTGTDPSAAKTSPDRVTSIQLSLVHGVDRIEPMGADAVVVGTDGRDLHFTAVRLSETPEVVDRFTRKHASQGELRSHGFFYKPDNSGSGGPSSGMLGLPISLSGRPGYRHLVEGSASILFLRNSSLRFEEVGELAAQPEKAVDDGCRASCVDWYGNARPLFVRGRIFALLGYEIVEGVFSDQRIREIRRVSYAPARAR